MRKRPSKLLLQTWLRDLEEIARSNGFTCDRWGISGDFPLLGFQRMIHEHAPRIYLSAGIHGDEPAGPLAIAQLLENRRLDLRANWTICPLLNPIGWMRGSREGPDGIDLNRDYLHPKTPEIIAHRAWIDRCGPHDLYLSLHEDWEATGFYLYEINTSNFAPIAGVILERVASVMRIEPDPCIDDHLVCAPGYIAHEPEPDEPLNWPEAIYHSKSYPHLSYTFETPSSFPLEHRVKALTAATETAVAEFIRRQNPSS